ncbi:UNVERIFIED_CONTAM: hypothetical protein FKN15_063720 [Acipenser sinensis]
MRGEEEKGKLLKLQKLKNIDSVNINSREMYKMCIKATHCSKLRGMADTKWRAQPSLGNEGTPEWRVLYKPPLDKRAGDLQWRLLHGILATGRFLHRINHDISSIYDFCQQEDTIFHMYSECRRLEPLFSLL